MKFLPYQYMQLLSVLLSVQHLAKLVFISIFCFFYQSSFAQEVKISGMVTDESGKKLGNTTVTYKNQKVVSNETKGFIFYLKEPSANFDETLVDASLAQYGFLKASFDKDNKYLTVIMVSAQENTGVLLDENKKPLAGGVIVFKVGKYTERKIASSNGGKFTIHLPKSNKIEEGTFSVNGTQVESKDMKFEPQGNGVNKITLTHIPPKKAQIVETPPTITKKSFNTFTFLLNDGKVRKPLANLKVVVEDAPYETDAKGRIILKNPILVENVKDPLVSGDYIVIDKDLDDVSNAIIYIKAVETTEVIVARPDIYKESFGKINEELNRTKDLLSIKTERIKEEITRLEEKLQTDKNLTPAQRQQYTEALANLKETLAKNEMAYNQIQEQSNEVLTRMQVIVSAKGDSLELLKRLAQILEEKNQKIEEERAIEEASFRNKILLSLVAALLSVFAAIYLFILSKRLGKQKEELAQTLSQVQQQKMQIESQNTQLQSQKKEIELKNIRLEELDKEKSSLMNIVAHDLKAPLNKVAGAAQLLPNLGELNEEQEEFVQMIRKVAFDGKKFIEDLLDLNAIEQQRPEAITWEKVPLESFISSAIIGYKQQADTKKIQLHFQPQLNGTEIDADRSYLNRIIDNLVSNAIKFSPQEKNIYIAAIENADTVSIAIKDEGPGISESDQKKMFKKFQKLSARPTAGESSTGLGLSIIKTLVERLNGEISVRSTLGEGTEFIVVLPKQKTA
jgi:signal transduction histidine kinase